MGCVNNKKKLFGIIPYNGKHTFEPWGLGQNPNGELFHRFYAVCECTQCKKRFQFTGLTTEEVRKLGFTENTILNTYNY